MANACTIYLTSRPYPIEVIESLESTGAPKALGQYQYAEAADIGADFLSGELDTILVRYEDSAPEALDIGADFLSGELAGGPVAYDNGEPEALDIGADFLSGSLDAILQQYSMYDEAIDIGADFLSGVLS